MKLQSISDGRLYATEGRTVLREQSAVSADRDSAAGMSRMIAINRDRFEPVGDVPVAATGFDGLRERALTTTPWKRALEGVVGSFQTINLWAFSPSKLLATSGQGVFYSHDGGQSWNQCLTLQPSSIQMGVLPSSVAHGDGSIYLAEYPLADDDTALVHQSTDGGASWQCYLELDDVRHVHSVSIDPYDGSCWLTTGDRDAECRLIRIRNGDMEVLGGGSQDWRIVELAFTHDAILWGVDCGYADTNDIFRLSRTALETATPTPEQVGTVDSSVYYAATVVVDGTECVVLSTAAESGADSTDDQAQAIRDTTADVVTASAESGFTDWTTIKRYPRRLSLGDRPRTPEQVPTANAYVLLASDSNRGLFLNPYNTTVDDGAIYQVPPAMFKSSNGSDITESQE